MNTSRSIAILGLLLPILIGVLSCSPATSKADLDKVAHTDLPNSIQPSTTIKESILDSVGWNGLRWGMKIEEVQERFPKAILGRTTDGEGYEVLSLKSYVFENQLYCAVNFSFRKGRESGLTDVDMWWDVTKGNSTDSAHHKLADSCGIKSSVRRDTVYYSNLVNSAYRNLRNRYGRESHAQNEGVYHRYFWDLPNTLVVFLDNGSGSLFLSYQSVSVRTE